VRKVRAVREQISPPSEEMGTMGNSIGSRSTGEVAPGYRI
jgi:hypothetical protein